MLFVIMDVFIVLLFDNFLSCRLYDRVVGVSNMNNLVHRTWFHLYNVRAFVILIFMGTDPLLAFCIIEVLRLCRALKSYAN